jgi:hypothetical protein
MAWFQLVLAVLLIWIASAVFVGVKVGHAFTLGQPDGR